MELCNNTNNIPRAHVFTALTIMILAAILQLSSHHLHLFTPLDSCDFILNNPDLH